MPGIDLPHVVQAWDVLTGKASTGDRVAVISQEDYYETPCVAEYLAERGKHVEVFHKSVHLGLRDRQLLDRHGARAAWRAAA